tara:strand:+ start:912 stop:1211 length:300 start_codon:yes stop_codon:yes gene_type:complete
MFSRIRPIFKQTMYINNYRKFSTENDIVYSNFIVSFTNVILITSLLWGVESYNKKLQTVKDCNHKINEIYLFCMKHKMDDPNNKDALRRRVTESIKPVK